MAKGIDQKFVHYGIRREDLFNRNHVNPSGMYKDNKIFIFSKIL